MKHTVKGLDVSHWQEPDAVDYAKLFADGYRYVWIKSSQGVGQQSKHIGHARAHALKASTAGLLCGVYHYADGKAPELEAAAFVEAAYDVGESMIGALPPVLDLEESVEGMSTTAWAKRFRAAANARFGRGIGIYTFHAFLQGDPALFTSEQWAVRWLADYRKSSKTTGPSYACDVWQETGSCKHPAVKGNFDRNFATQEAFDAWRAK